MRLLDRSISIFTYIDRYTPFVDVWIQYYKKTIPGVHIYILHRSTSTFDLTEYILEQSYDHTYERRINTTLDSYVVDMDIFSNMQHELLSAYDVVLYADIDEIIIHENLYSILQNPFDKCLVTRGIEIVQKVETEDHFRFDLDILKQRSYMIYSDWYDKPLIINAPCTWTNGKHNQGIYQNYVDGLYLVHMGKICIELFKQNWQSTIDMYPRHHSYVESHNFSQYYIEHFSNNAIEIPNNIRKLIKLI